MATLAAEDLVWCMLASALGAEGLGTGEVEGASARSCWGSCWPERLRRGCTVNPSSSVQRRVLHQAFEVFHIASQRPQSAAVARLDMRTSLCCIDLGLKAAVGSHHLLELFCQLVQATLKLGLQVLEGSLLLPHVLCKRLSSSWAAESHFVQDGLRNLQLLQPGNSVCQLGLDAFLWQSAAQALIQRLNALLQPRHASCELLARWEVLVQRSHVLPHRDHLHHAGSAQRRRCLGTGPDCLSQSISCLVFSRELLAGSGKHWKAWPSAGHFSSQMSDGHLHRCGRAVVKGHPAASRVAIHIDDSTSASRPESFEVAPIKDNYPASHCQGHAEL
mmetsp:Transcript_21822/g.44972  ORF Transcript_21822/g.44972 Transcript_21822/m.44972 type:complete len:332 (-) Transcript_21822:16-1011(-)